MHVEADGAQWPPRSPDLTPSDPQAVSDLIPFYYFQVNSLKPNTVLHPIIMNRNVKNTSHYNNDWFGADQQIQTAHNRKLNSN